MWISKQIYVGKRLTHLMFHTLATYLLSLFKVEIHTPETVCILLKCGAFLASARNIGLGIHTICCYQLGLFLVNCSAIYMPLVMMGEILLERECAECLHCLMVLKKYLKINCFHIVNNVLNVFHSQKGVNHCWALSLCYLVNILSRFWCLQLLLV